MERKYRDRWKKVIKFLENLPPEKFNFNRFVTECNNGCGTVCCVVGWFADIFPRSFKWENLSTGKTITSCSRKGNAFGSIEDAATHLGVSYYDARQLFDTTNHNRERYGPNPEPKVLVKYIKEYLAGLPK